MLSRRRLLIAAAAVVLAGGAAAYGYFEIYKPPGDVSNPDVEFTESEPPPKPKAELFEWPIYGFTNVRTHYLRTELKPPFRRAWTFRGKGLLEYSPVLAKGTLFLVRNNGTAAAFSAKTGRTKWSRDVGALNASSPAWWKDRLFVSTLAPKRIVSLDAKTGRTIWKRRIPSRTESSPLVVKGIVYFGSEDGTVYALRAKTGRTVWTYRTADAVYGVSYHKRRLVFGDKSGRVTSVLAHNGRRVWQAETSGARLGRAGYFYSTPAIAFGRVFIGNTDDKVYSFSERTGKLAWTVTTGNYVYGGPAVADVPGLGPTVYVGSYDSVFYALNARNGAKRWSYDSGDSISGAATIVGNVVYFSSFDHTTTGLGVKTGRVRFRWPDGRYNPVISDGKRLYLTGYSQVYGLVPKKAKRKRAKRSKRAERARAKSRKRKSARRSKHRRRARKKRR